MIDPQAQALKWIKNMEGNQVQSWGWGLLPNPLSSQGPAPETVPPWSLSGSPTVPSALQGLQIIDLQMRDYLQVLEKAIQFGYPVLLQNVQEYLDPTLNPVLNKSVARIG